MTKFNGKMRLEVRGIAPSAEGHYAATEENDSLDIEVLLEKDLKNLLN